MLPAAAPRQEAHCRRIDCRGYLRDDGLWDIEAELLDTRSAPFALYMRTVPAGTPLHLMAIRLTVDDALTVRDIAVGHEHTPYPLCHDAAEPMRGLVGRQIGPGWRQAVQENLGATKGCAHLRDLLASMAPVVYQTVHAHFQQAHVLEVQAALAAGDEVPPRAGPPPFFLDQCLAFAFDSKLTQTYEPAHYRWNERPGAARPPAMQRAARPGDGQANKELLLRIFAELSSGQGKLLMETLADDIRWTVTGNTEFSGTFTGKQQVRKLASDVGERLAGPIVFTPVLCLADGDRVVLQVDGKAFTRSGKPYDNRYCMVARFAGGKLAELIEYNDTELVTAALCAAG